MVREQWRTKPRTEIRSSWFRLSITGSVLGGADTPKDCNEGNIMLGSWCSISLIHTPALQRHPPHFIFEGKHARQKPLTFCKFSKVGDWSSVFRNKFDLKVLALYMVSCSLSKNMWHPYLWNGSAISCVHVLVNSSHHYLHRQQVFTGDVPEDKDFSWQQQCKDMQWTTLPYTIYVQSSQIKISR